MSEAPKVRKLLRAESVAERLDMDVRHVYRLCREGVLPFVRIGRSVRFDEQILDDWLAAGGASYPGGWKKGEP